MDQKLTSRSRTQHPTRFQIRQSAAEVAKVRGPYDNNYSYELEHYLYLSTTLFMKRSLTFFHFFNIERVLRVLIWESTFNRVDLLYSTTGPLWCDKESPVNILMIF